MANLSQTSFYGDDDQALRGPKGDKGDIGPQGPAGPSGIPRPLPILPNNAAALAAGLLPDDIYKTATGELRAVV